MDSELQFYGAKQHAESAPFSDPATRSFAKTGSGQTPKIALQNGVSACAGSIFGFAPPMPEDHVDLPMGEKVTVPVAVEEEVAA